MKKVQLEQALRLITKDRKRTNLLRKYEQAAIAYLVQRLPKWVTPNMLTAIGFIGNLTVSISFILAKFYNEEFLLLGVLGFAISWFGDSLDGRLAYYRNRPRKWFGFSIDLITDWLGITAVGLGFMIYAQNVIIYIGYLIISFYAWEIIIALIRYKVTNKYSIDSGIFGPTEVRILISIILILEIFFYGIIFYLASITMFGLAIAGTIDTLKLLKLADERDEQEKN